VRARAEQPLACLFDHPAPRAVLERSGGRWIDRALGCRHLQRHLCACEAMAMMMDAIAALRDAPAPQRRLRSAAPVGAASAGETYQTFRALIRHRSARHRSNATRRLAPALRGGTDQRYVAGTSAAWLNQYTGAGVFTAWRGRLRCWPLPAAAAGQVLSGLHSWRDAWLRVSGRCSGSAARAALDV
jgi:hypothetical protein